MAQAKLITRVRGHITSGINQGRATVALFVECVEHFEQHNDWTPLAELIGGQDASRGATLRRYSNNVVKGWNIRKDEKQRGGLAFKKDADANQGFDQSRLDQVRDLVKNEETIGGAAAKVLFKPVTEQVDDKQAKCITTAQNAVAKIAKALGMTEAQAIAFIQANGVKKKDHAKAA